MMENLKTLSCAVSRLISFQLQKVWVTKETGVLAYKLTVTDFSLISKVISGKCIYTKAPKQTHNYPNVLRKVLTAKLNFFGGRNPVTQQLQTKLARKRQLLTCHFFSSPPDWTVNAFICAVQLLLLLFFFYCYNKAEDHLLMQHWKSLNGWNWPKSDRVFLAHGWEEINWIFGL